MAVRCHNTKYKDLYYLRNMFTTFIRNTHLRHHNFMYTAPFMIFYIYGIIHTGRGTQIAPPYCSKGVGGGQSEFRALYTPWPRNFRSLGPSNLLKIAKTKIMCYVENEEKNTENYGVFRVLRPKIARDVHDLKHRKLQKRKLRGRKLRGHGVLKYYIASHFW